jgi:hypothetical protein
MINIHPTFIKEKLNAQLNGEGIGSGTLGDLRLTTRGIGEMEWPLLNSQFNFGSWQEVMGVLGLQISRAARELARARLG